MNKKSVILVLLVVILAGGYFLLGSKPTSAPSYDDETVGATGSKTYKVEMTNGGFNPSELTILGFDTVEFLNKDATPHWPASGMHPTHELCKGFDSLRGLKQGETYSFRFTGVKTCPMHDHLNASLRGKIIIK